MDDNPHYIRIYTTYSDNSFAGVDIFRSGNNTKKAFDWFKENFSVDPNINVTAVPFDIRTASKKEIRAFREAEKEGCVYDL